MLRHELVCACCGGKAPPQPQSHQQDAGFGLCYRCAVWIEERNGADYLATHYGVRGAHTLNQKEQTYGRDNARAP